MARPATTLAAQTNVDSFDVWARKIYDEKIDKGTKYEDWLNYDRPKLEEMYQSRLPAAKRADVGPPLAPDITSKLVREARTAQLLRLQLGRGRRSQFLTGPVGLPGPKFSPLLGG
jgi:hypothetical protein